jgi:hypothetical protein
MQNNRRTILSLVAIGRITPVEAERLLIALNVGRETHWTFVACIVIALLAPSNSQQRFPALLHLTRALLPGLTLHHAMAQTVHVLGSFFGGMQ